MFDNADTPSVNVSISLNRLYSQINVLRPIPMIGSSSTITILPCACPLFTHVNYLYYFPIPVILDTH